MVNKKTTNDASKSNGLQNSIGDPRVVKLYKQTWEDNTLVMILSLKNITSYRSARQD